MLLVLIFFKNFHQVIYYMVPKWLVGKSCTQVTCLYLIRVADVLQNWTTGFARYSIPRDNTWNTTAKETTNFSNQHMLSVPLIFSAHLPVAFPFWHPRVDQYSFELVGGIKTTRLSCAFSLYRGLLPRHVLRCGFPIWQPNGWLGFCTSGPVTYCLLPHSALKGIICISEVLGTFQDSTYETKFYLNKQPL